MLRNFAGPSSLSAQGIKRTPRSGRRKRRAKERKVPSQLVQRSPSGHRPPTRATRADIAPDQPPHDPRERSRDHADASSDWLWETDAELRFTYFSGQFTALTGISDEHAIGRTRVELARKSGLENAKLRRHEADLESRPRRCTALPADVARVKGYIEAHCG